MTADVEVCIYKVTDDAATLWDDVKESGLSLYQIQLRHDAYNSATVNLHDRFNSFLKVQDDAPENLAELQRRALIKLVTTTDDPDDVGFVRWRNAFYVAGGAKALLNAMFLLDDFWFYVSSELGKDVNVSLHPHIGINIDGCWDYLLYEYSLHEPAQNLPMGIVEAAPVQGKRVLQLTLQVESDDKLSFVVHGPTWPFRDKFDSCGIPGYRWEENGQSKYYRVLEGVNCDNADEREKVLKMLGEGVLFNTAMRVTIDGGLKPGTSAFKFVQTLRSRMHLHFV